MGRPTPYVLLSAIAVETLTVLPGFAIVVKVTFLPAVSPADVTVAVYCVPYLSCDAGSHALPSELSPPATAAPEASVSVTWALEPGSACRDSSVAVGMLPAPSFGAAKAAFGSSAADAEAEGPPALLSAPVHFGLTESSPLQPAARTTTLVRAAIVASARAETPMSTPPSLG